MKQGLTSLDLYYLVKELQELVGARVDKFFEQADEKREFLFVFHKTGAGKKMLRIKLPGLVYLTEHKQLFPETPPGFCVFLRKHLGNARIKEVRQRGFERILEIVFETKGGELTLICELFSKGNMILIDENKKIKGLLESQNWEARTVRGGTLYEYPPEQANPLQLTDQAFRKMITSSSFDSIVKMLAVEIGLGGLYAEELCARAGLDKSKKQFSEEKLMLLYHELKKLLDESIKANIAEGEIVPFEMMLHKEQEKQYFENFNSALDSLSEKVVSVAQQKEAKEKKTKQDKIRVVLEKQNKRLAELEKSIAENQRKGELIYEHYPEAKEILDSINRDRKKMDWEELKKKYKNEKLIKEIDEKNGKIIVEF